MPQSRSPWGLPERASSSLDCWRLTSSVQPQPLSVSSAAVGCNALLGGSPSGTLFRMTIKAHVRAGRLIVDEPTDLPDGTELELLPLDPGDWLDDANRTALHDALRQSEDDVSAGRLVDASDVLKHLRAR